MFYAIDTKRAETISALIIVETAGLEQSLGDTQNMLVWWIKENLSHKAKKYS